MVVIVSYAVKRIQGWLAFAVLLLGCVASLAAEGAKSIDLTALDCYVRQGFSYSWSVSGPDLTDRNWLVVPPNPGNRPVIIQALPIPGKPAPQPFAIRPDRAQTYTFVFAFDAAPELLSSSTGVGLYLSAIGKNWEVYLNGNRIYSEVYRARSGWFERERSVRGALVDVDMRTLKQGRNYLAIEIFGNSSDDRTGLFAGGPYLIGDYQALLRLKSEYVDLMLIGIYLFFGLYHLVLFVLRPANKPYLFYGLGTLAFAIYLFTRTYIVFSVFPDTAVIRGAELSSLFIFFPLFLAFFDLCNGSGKISPFTIGFGIAGILFGLVAPFLWAEPILKLWQAMMPFMALYLIVADIVLPLVRAFGPKKPGNFGDKLKDFARADSFWTIVIAFLIFVLCAVAFALDLNSAAALTVIKFGAFALIFGMAAVLVGKFTVLLTDVEDLTSGLEAKVNERTLALSGAMAEQSSLNASLQAANRTLQETMDSSAADMKIAVQVQQGIFPRMPPELSDWDVAIVSQPVSGVSGDFHDFFVADGSLKGLVVGDVSGHGISSGLITVLSRSIFWRAFRDLSVSSLGRVMEDINAELSVELASVENYLTAIFLRFDGDTVEYANGGHTDLCFRRARKARANVLVPTGQDFKGPPLGREGISAPFRSVKFAVGSGDSLLLYTDCLIDSRDEDGKPFGIDGLLSAYGRAPDDSAADMLEYIMEDWKFHLGEAEVADDLTVVLLKKK